MFNTMAGSLLFAAIALLPAAVSVDTKTGDEAKYSGKVLVISMDGFRWDYTSMISGLGNFSRMTDHGCTVDYVESAFQTKTFPCHYTIATGLFEESHGIVANRMFDPVRNATFGKRSFEPFWWNGGEPMWVTAEKQNKSSGVLFWPGSEAEIRGYRPSVSRPYDESETFANRVQQAMNWFKEGKDLVMLYFHEPDRTGHNHGPNSSQVADKVMMTMVREMDGLVGLLFKSLEEEGLVDDVNVIITSDYGMTDISLQRLLDLWDYIDQDMVERVPDSGTVTAILPAEGREEDVLNAAKAIPHVTAYRKADIPDHLHYKHNDRIMPIIILADEGWILSSRKEKVIEDNELGEHGYSNKLPSMRGIFFASGPDFKKGVKSESIRSVDIYPLVCRLLNIPASQNNGSLAHTQHFLVNGASQPVLPSRGSHIIGAFLMAIIYLFSY